MSETRFMTLRLICNNVFSCLSVNTNVHKGLLKKLIKPGTNKVKVGLIAPRRYFCCISLSSFRSVFVLVRSLHVSQLLANAF